MKKQQNLATDKLIKKFDNQLRDILAADIRSVRFARTKVLNALGLNHPLAS